MAGVVDQDFDLNSVALQLLENFLRRVLLLEILRDHTDIDTVISPELGCGVLEFRLDGRDDDERMAVSGKFMREMESDSTGSTGDERGVVVYR